MDRNELLCSIARSEKKIKDVEQWRSTDFKSRCDELSQLQAQLEEEIAREDDYHRKIAQKLDQIARLKMKIGENVAENNSFRFDKK